MKQCKRLVFLCCYLILQLSAVAQQEYQLKVGDKLSKADLSRWVHQSDSSTSTEYKHKAVIIDFWAPWCSPCLATFPKLFKLQQQNKNQLSVLLVTREDKGYAERTLGKFKSYRNSFISIAQDTTFSRIFPHRILPHYVWIDKNGFVKAITGSEELTESNINKFLSKDVEELSLPTKRDTLIIPGAEPLFSIDKVTLKNNVLCHSLLTKYMQDINAASVRGRNWINCTKQSISFLYKMAFGEFGIPYINNNRMILEGFETRDDSLMVGFFTPESKEAWRKMMFDHTYNYELVVPDSNISITGLFKYMQADLNRFFHSKGIEGRKEVRNMNVLTLVRISKEDLIRTKGGTPMEQFSDNFIELRNKNIFFFVSKLQGYIYTPGALPIEDETGYEDNIDLTIEADLKDINAVNAALAKYKLRLVEVQRPIEMIVLKKQSKVDSTDKQGITLR